MEENKTKSIAPIEYNGERVLTTKQVAEIYGVDIKRLSMNFSNHRENYKEGKHYYKLEGKELQEFKDLVNQVYPVKSNTPVLILWTEKGVLYHSKLLGTKKAWEIFEELSDTYYKVKQANSLVDLSTIQQSLTIIQDSFNEVREDIKEIKGEIVEIKKDIKPAKSWTIFENSGSWLNSEALSSLLGIGRNILYAMLKADGIIDANNLPNAQFVSAHPGFLKIKTTKACDGTNNDHTLYHSDFPRWYQEFKGFV